MSRLATIALALITSLLSSQSDAEATPRWKRQSTTPRFQIVGFTTATFQGKAGVLAFSLTCGQEIQGARLCSSEEVLESTEIPSDLAGAGWVRATAETADPVSPGSTCNGWISARDTDHGLVVVLNSVPPTPRPALPGPPFWGVSLCLECR